MLSTRNVKSPRTIRRLIHGAALGAVLIVFSSAALAQEHLIMVGGGPRPPAAMSKFVDFAGKQQARILIIPWATEEAEASFESLKKDFEPFHPSNFELAPSGPLTDVTRTEFLKQLRNATGVFFTGGDQVKIMQVLKDETLLRALKERYAAGVVFGGTSAGTAIMSHRMITGEGDFTVIDGTKVQTTTGLGLLPENVIVDQHFIKRQRQNRLFGLILGDRKAIGIGIDEGTALIVSDNRIGEVVGASKVMIVDPGTQANGLTILLKAPGEKLDLQRHSSNRGVSKAVR
jgi:cyanophycinase